MSNYDYSEALGAGDVGEQEGQQAAPEQQQQQELDAVTAALVQEEIHALKERMAARYPAAAKLLDFVSADSPEAYEEIVYDINQRLGGSVVDDDHPGADSEARAIAALPGADVKAKAVEHARQTGDVGAVMALKTAAALEAAGISGTRLTAQERATVEAAARFAKMAGDSEAHRRILRQLG